MGVGERGALKLACGKLLTLGGPTRGLMCGPFFIPPPAVMTDAFRGIWELSQQDGIPLRTAAFAIALQRVLRARLNRGFD
jgi:hypothetical protein